MRPPQYWGCFALMTEERGAGSGMKGLLMER